MTRKNVIKCPYCGCEYLPAEIFYPRDFLGEPYNIIKDENGEILGFNGSDMDLTETFECDQCNKKFKIEAVVSFKTEPYVDIFDEEDEEAFFNTTAKTAED